MPRRTLPPRAATEKEVTSAPATESGRCAFRTLIVDFVDLGETMGQCLTDGYERWEWDFLSEERDGYKPPRVWFHAWLPGANPNEHQCECESEEE